MTGMADHYSVMIMRYMTLGQLRRLRVLLSRINHHGVREVAQWDRRDPDLDHLILGMRTDRFLDHLRDSHVPG